MEKRLIQTLLRICASNDERVQSPSSALMRFCADYNIGWSKGASMIFSEQDKELIAGVLKEDGVDADAAKDVEWNTLTRAEALQFAQNEKMTSASVRVGRVAIKSLPGRPLLLGRELVNLPAGTNLDASWAQVAELCAHESVLLIENWECFERIHQVTLDLTRAGENPLVLFRGSPIYQQDSTSNLLKALAVPVIAFVDFDPAGLLIAQGLPHFAGLIWPNKDELVPALLAARNHERYLMQLGQTRGALEGTTNTEISECWALLRHFGAALPQEYFITSDLSGKLQNTWPTSG